MLSERYQGVKNVYGGDEQEKLDNLELEQRRVYYMIQKVAVDNGYIISTEIEDGIPKIQLTKVV